MRESEERYDMPTSEFGEAMNHSDTVAMIELKSVYKVYSMGDVDVPALDGVDLTIQRGDYVAITGQSGSGKSTLLHLLGCLDTPTSGEYKLEGNSVTNLPDRELSRIRNQHFGFIFQAYNLLSDMTALENVEQPLVYAGVRAKQRRERAVAALAKVGLSERLGHMPSQLSGGQQQRVAIARALVTNPTLLLADEPTGNLNSEASELILGILDTLHKTENTSIVMITHDPKVAAHAKRHLLIKDGRITDDTAARGVVNRQSKVSVEADFVAV